MIIFIYGADTFRSRRFLQELKEKFIRDIDPDSGSLSVVDGPSATLKEINDQINTGSLFVKKRLVVIENIFRSKKEKFAAELAEYLTKFTGGEDNILIFRDEELDTKDCPVKAATKKLFTFLTKQPYSRRFDPLDNNQLLVFIRKEAAQYKKEIGAAAATRLIDLTGGDLWSIAQEIKKLSNYASEPAITREDVDQLVAGAVSEDIFGLTDALSARNKKTAISLLEEQYAAGLSDEYLLTMLVRQFKILLQIRAALEAKMDATTMATNLKLHPFIIRKGVSQAKNFTTAELKNYLDHLIRLDFSNKTGRGDTKTELTLLIGGL